MRATLSATRTLHTRPQGAPRLPLLTGAQAQHGLEDPILTPKEFRAPPRWQGEVLGRTRGRPGAAGVLGPWSQGSVPWAGNDNEKGIMILHKKDAQLVLRSLRAKSPSTPLATLRSACEYPPGVLHERPEGKG